MIKEVGVIGAGQMGGGIAQVCAQAGFSVTLLDNNGKQLESAQKLMNKLLDKQISKGKVSTKDKDSALANLKLTESSKDLKDCDIVIEAVSESIDLKLKIFEEVCKVTSDKTILASNTSSISITQLAARTPYPENFIGLHFMNPVPVMKLVEVIKSLTTSDSTYKTSCELIEKIGKTIVTSLCDRPGFIVNRILMPMINEAAFTLSEGVGSAHDIDTSMKLGTNHPMGPLELADFIGLDTCLAIMEVLFEGFADSKYRPCPLLKNYVDAGWYGRKVGKGFYDYSKDPATPTL